jgi:outer membrane protein assembly factor BamB
MAVPASGPQPPPSRNTAAAVRTQALPSAVRWTVAVSARPAAAPVIEGPRIFLVLQSGIVAAHRLSDGVEVWRVELRTEHSVAADGARVFIASGEAIHALNAETSDVLWRAPVDTITAPLLAHNGWVIAVTETAVTAFRADDGSKVWTRPNGAQRERPTIEGDNLYLPLEDGHLFALDLQTGAERWSRHFRGAMSEVLAFSDRIYVGSADKHFYCLDAESGDWPRKGWRTFIGAALRGRPAADESRVFTASKDNALRAFDRGHGALRWQNSVPFRPTIGPAVIGSMVVVPGTAKEIPAFDVMTKRPAGQIALAEEPVVAPAFAASGSATVVVAVTGGLKGEFMLALFEPPLPSIPLVPLTALPGITVPVEPPAPK